MTTQIRSTFYLAEGKPRSAALRRVFPKKYKHFCFHGAFTWRNIVPRRAPRGSNGSVGHERVDHADSIQIPLLARGKPRSAAPRRVFLEKYNRFYFHGAFSLRNIALRRAPRGINGSVCHERVATQIRSKFCFSLGENRGRRRRGAFYLRNIDIFISTAHFP